MSKPIGIVRFPGSNCDEDVVTFVREKNKIAKYLWHLDLFNKQDFEALIIPGGFSYGDYLRTGALSARSPVMSSVMEFAESGSPVLGICNGFQILTEAKLLPGALVKNSSLRFIDDWVELKLENKAKYFAQEVKTKICLPIAHGEGRFYADENTLHELKQNNQIWFSYLNNPNGSLLNIAGIMNKNRNVMALMPHPERAIFSWLGSEDGWGFL